METTKKKPKRPSLPGVAVFTLTGGGKRKRAAVADRMQQVKPNNEFTVWPGNGYTSVYVEFKASKGNHWSDVNTVDVQNLARTLGVTIDHTYQRQFPVA